MALVSMRQLKIVFFVLHAASPFNSFLMDAVSVSLRVRSIGPGRKTLIMMYSNERQTSKHLAGWVRRKNHPCRHQHRPECPYLLRPAGISLCLCHLCRSHLGLGNVLQIVCFHVTCFLSSWFEISVMVSLNAQK